MAEQYLDIIDLIQTKSQADTYLSEIELLRNSLYNVKDTVDEKMGKYLSQSLKERILSQCGKGGINSKNDKEFGHFLDGLKTTIQGLKKVTLHIAFEPKSDTIKTIFSWFSVNHKERLIIDVLVDKDLVGGAIIDFEGKHKEVTLKHALEEKFKKGEIKSLLKEI